jgi:amino acid transporter
LDDLAENPVIKVSLGIVFIAIMTYISYRGIVISERIQAVFVSFQFVVLIVMNIIALVPVYGGSVGAQAVHPEWSWFSPFGLSASEIAAGVILCIFIYWGWDSCLAVTEETKDADKTPGRAALISTVILLFTYLIVAVAIQAFAGFGDTGIGLANEENSDNVLTIVGEPILGAVMTSVLLLTVAVSAASSTQTTILPTARGAWQWRSTAPFPGVSRTFTRATRHRASPRW